MQTHKDLELLARREPWSPNVSFVFRCLVRDESYAYAEPIILKVRPRELEGTIIESAFNLTDDNAQKLMNQLWDCGLRPSAGAGSAGQLAAVQYHLEDMRKLVFTGMPK